jgi:hypothetical protein
VPIEGPPLSGLDLSRIDIPSAELVSIDTATGEYDLLTIGGISILTVSESLEVTRKSATASQSVESLLDREEIWEPTIQVAAEAMRQLSTASKYPVSLNSDVKPLPNVNRREATRHMENWMAPIRAWYNADISPFNYSDQPNSGATLEVGISNYELSAGYFLVQVMMKLVDPASGSVIANARKASNRKVDDLDSLFEGDATGFKQLFHETTVPLVKECIDKLGLDRS